MYYGYMLRPRDRTLATPYFPVGGPVPAADLVGRETYLRRLIERLGQDLHADRQARAVRGRGEPAR